MKVGSIIRKEEDIYRVLESNTESKRLLVVDCRRQSMPKWIDADGCTEADTAIYENHTFHGELTPSQLSEAHRRLSLITGIVCCLGDVKKRSEALERASACFQTGKQTIRKYLWRYLVYDTIDALAPAERKGRENKELSSNEKTMRWALNKFYYTKNKNTLNEAYVMMLKERYTDKDGRLVEEKPSFYQFRYFYRKTRKLKRCYISRDGIKVYQKTKRPLLGDGVQQMAVCAGFGMMDATVCDIYLVNDAGGVVGRPILTACVDAYSGLCTGYSLAWEGGVYSLTDLMLNVIADKKAHCGRFGIDSGEWDCCELPSVLITDMGSEYISANFEQISELGVTLVNLPAYRPDLKGPVEQFFDCIQSEFKPYLKGKGVIEPDFQERGVHDYRRDACLTMETFEKVILWCIIHYNTKRIVDFPFTEQMLDEKVKPYAQDIYDWSKENQDCALIMTTPEKLALTLLPRCTGSFTRKGLIVNQMRYRCEGFDEEFLKGGEAVTAYNPEDSSFVWLKTRENFIRFELIESRFREKDVASVEKMKEQQKNLLKEEGERSLQADIDLARHLELLVRNAETDGVRNRIKSIRENRKREKKKTHKNHAREAGVYAE